MTVRGLVRRRLEGDEGVAMIIVVGFTITMAMLLAIMFSITTASLDSSRKHTAFERALSVAESGVDKTLGRLQHQYDVNRGDWPHPGPANPDCTGSTLSTPAFTSADQERTWARSQLEGLIATCAESTQDGEYVVVKPVNRQTVYALGAVPSFAAANGKRRLLKTEYLFSPYRPSHAVLTSGSLCISGSVMVDATDPSKPANVHTNADADCGGGGGTASGTIEGQYTSSGSYNVNPNINVGAGSGGGKPEVAVPNLDPRYLYDLHPQYVGRWYDLCPDGSVRLPAGSAPCTGTALSTSGAPYQGWDFVPGGGTDGAPLWRMQTHSSPYTGVYYVYQGDAVVGGNGSTTASDPAWNATVIAESAPSGGSVASCGKLGGNIEWKLEHVRNVMTGIVFFAQADLKGSANSHAESGLFVAGDQLMLNTSSGSLTGAVIAGDACKADTTQRNSVQGFTVKYTGSLEAPLTSVVRSTLWLEYVG